MAKNTVMGRAVEHAPFNYIGGHPDYPQMIKGRQLRLCVVEDGLTLVKKKPSGILFSEKVLLHIPREQLREVRDISSLVGLGGSPAFIEVILELNGTSHTAKFQANGVSTVQDAIKIAAAAQHLIRGY